MASLKHFRFIFKEEPIFNIRRDYSYLTKRKRIIITLTIILEFAISISILQDNFPYFKKIIHSQPSILFSTLVFHTAYFIQSILVVVYFGPRSGRDFKKLLSSLGNSYDIVKSQPQYSKSLLRAKVVHILAIAAWIIYIIVACTYWIVSLAQDIPNTDVFSLFLVIVFRAWSENRFVMELIVYCSILTVINITLRSVTELARDPSTLENEIDNIALGYKQLLESSRSLKACFGHQILLSLFIAASHSINILYETLHVLLAKGYFTKSSMFYLVFFISMFIIVAKKGQDVRDGTIQLGRVLAKTVNERVYSDAVKPSLRSLKDFHRIVCTEPLGVELLPTLPVGMYFLPAVLSLTVNYIIVSLQMSHDI